MSAGTGSDAAYDLVVVGGNAGGLSVAIAAQTGGLGRVRILEPSAAMAGARVVLAAGGLTPKKLSPIGQAMLRRLERERMATILFRAVPVRITEDDGLPLANFGDRRTPELEFDRVVFASGRTPVSP